MTGVQTCALPIFILQGAKTGVKFGHQKMIDIMVHDGLWDSFNNFHMGSAAELTRKKNNITREMQDEYAYNSHRKATEAWAANKFDAEIFDIEVPQRKKDPIIFNKDEGFRPGISAEKLAKLRPAFEKDGTVTAGNAPGLNDGCSATVVVSGDYMKAHGLKPLAKIIDYATAGTAPEDVFFAPIFAVEKLMKKMNVDINHWDLIEANEAFAAQAIADGQGLKWDDKKVNVNGGAIALGHPIGASGTRILTTLIYALKDRGLKTGMATLCLGGGNAVAMAIEIS